VLGRDDCGVGGNIGVNGIGAETRLAAPNDRWKGAVQLTAGEFTGNNTSDLAVRWDNATLSIFPDVNAGGFNGEFLVSPPNTSWNNATVVAAGAFATNGRPNDMLVRWVDGEVSLYPGRQGRPAHRGSARGAVTAWGFVDEAPTGSGPGFAVAVLVLLRPLPDLPADALTLLRLGHPASSAA
jgi:hypothetical protein